MNVTGKPVRAMAVGGQIPGPLLEFTEGDTLRVTFHNKMDADTLIHWHGLLLPPDQDGVPFLNTPPIPPGKSHTFTFPIRQAGTYWYHSHVGLQEQRGVYGPIVIHPRSESKKADREAVVVLSDWTDENPRRVLEHLKKDGDWYAWKKGSVQSWYKVLKNRALGARLKSALSRMPPMDLSDVGYDAFLINGQTRASLGPTKPGERIRLRVINAGSSSYFNLEFAGGDMTLVAADGQDVEPIAVRRVLMGMAETYDFLVTVPDARAYELRATAQDGTGYASGILGEATEVVAAPDIPKPNLFKMSMGGHGEGHVGAMGHAGHGMPGMGAMKPGEGGRILEDYGPLRAPAPTTLPPGNPSREVVLELTGFMEGYVWSFNDTLLSEADWIRIRKGENVRFVFVNKTMMWHPLHLHGHFFRVLNGQGDYSPLKHTVNVPPNGRVTIEFLADQEKDWFFHCHNLYHMMGGMARVVHYEGPDDAISKKNARRLAEETGDEDWFMVGNIGLQSNMLEGFLSGFSARNSFELDFDYNYRKEYEITPVLAHRFTQFFSLIVGGNFERDELETGNSGLIGVRYVLPLLIDAELHFDTEAVLRLTLGSELQLTDRLQFGWEYQFEYEIRDNRVKNDYHLELEYRFTKNFGLVANWDSDFFLGGGVMLRF
ncbi:copper oxidase [Deltaproteobacteria bacterium PRO3]|nr:copper oxidase [Deltaproteobacteria bacterium PRO3]